MKKIALFVAIATLATACQQEAPVAPESSSTPRQTFRARFIVPLSHDRVEGEEMVVDKELIRLTNVPELAPVMAKISADAYDGKIPTYPDGGEDKSNDPKTYLKRHAQDMVKSGIPFNIADLGMNVEVVYRGTSTGAGSLLLPEYMDLIWADPNETLPFRRMARIFVKDLRDYNVQDGERSVAFPEYMADRAYEHYPIYVEAPLDTFGLRAYTDVPLIASLIAKGDMENLVSPYNKK